MANTIKVTYKVNEDGSLEQISKKAEKAAQSTDKLAKSSDNYSKKQKGVAGATSNSTKAFSKMTTGITGGLVPAYATLAANVFALSAAFNFFKRAADVKILEEGQKSYGKTTGLALQTVTRNLREASGGMLGFREAAEAAAIGVAKGFSPSQLNELAEGARKASAALGRNFEDSFDRLIRGASKAEPELLDELGITLRLETATKNYATSVNKTAKELTAFERSQAVLIETQRQLNDLYGDVDAVTNPFVKLGKTFDDLVKNGTNFIMPLFEGIANIINRSAIAAIAVFGALGVSILKSMVPMDGLKDAFNKFEIRSAESLAHAINDQKNYQAELEKTKAALKEASIASAQSAARKLQAGDIGTTSKLVSKAARGELTDPKQIGQLKAALKKAEAQYKIHNEVKKGIFKGADIEVLRSFKASLEAINRPSITFLQKQKMMFKQLTLSAKVQFTKIKSIGVSTFSALSKAAAAAGKAMNAAMRAAGFIGMFMMVLEIGRELLNVPYDIVMGIAKGIDFVIKGLMKMFGSLVDGLGNMYKGFLNLLIAGWNKIAESSMGQAMGLGAISEFNSNSTAARDAMENLADSMVGVVGLVEKYGGGLKTFQEGRQRIQEQKEAYDALKDSIRETGKELNNIADGLGDKKGASKEIAAANALGSLNISGLMKSIEKVEDTEKQANAVKLLRTQLERVGELSPELKAAFDSMDIEKIMSIEGSALAATAGLSALKDGISNINSSLSSGDLLSAEFALRGLQETAGATSDAFKALFGEDSKAAAKALADFEASFSSADTTAGEFLESLTSLRKRTEELTRAQESLNFATGAMKNILDARLNLQGAILALKAKEMALDLESDPKKRELIAQEIEILKLKEKQAAIAVGDTIGMGDSARMGAMAKGTGETLANEDASTSSKLQAMMAFTSPMVESLRQLGPEGELISAAVQGALVMSEAFATGFEQIANEGDKLQAGLMMAGAAVQALGQLQQAQSNQAVSAIDKQIEAEKKRDGKSAASQAKLAALEKKKDAIKRKAFEQNKKMQMASTVINTASAIIAVMDDVPAPYNFVLAGLVGAMGVAQLAAISSASYDGGASSIAKGPSSISIGNRQNSVDLAKARSPSGELAYARGAQGTGTGMTNYTPAFTGAKYRAGGGNVGLMVGEQGPEMFIPDRPGTIVPADETQGFTGQPVNVNFSIQAIDSAGVEDLLMVQRGNIIGMIREAANSHGELFLENINDQSLPVSRQPRRY